MSLSDFAENVYAKLVSRYVLPAAIVVIGSIGNYLLGVVTRQAEAVQSRVESLGVSQASIERTLAIALEQIRSNREKTDNWANDFRVQFDHHERRLEALEQRNGNGNFGIRPN